MTDLNSHYTTGPDGPSPESFDHRTRSWKVSPRWGYFASDPCNGLGERLPRERTLLLGRWRVTLARTREAGEQRG